MRMATQTLDETASPGHSPLETPHSQLPMNAPELGRLEKMVRHVTHEPVSVVNLKRSIERQPRNNVVEVLLLHPFEHVV